MKKMYIAPIIALILILSISWPVYAISNPDSAPLIEDVYVFRNALETGDMFIVLKENTPYATPPADKYADCFVWQLYDPTDTYEIAQATGYDYHDDGYNENIISFYFSADDAPDWGEAYYLRLVGTPSAFASPPVYQFQLAEDDYSELTEPLEVLSAISTLILVWANELNTDWDLDPDDYLTSEGTTGNILSFDGQVFFRGAIYGIQSLAPYAFDLQIQDITNEPRDWDYEYSTNMTTAFSGTYIGDGADDANDMLGAPGYNLFGLIMTLLICAAMIGGCMWMNGNLWIGAIFASAILVVCGRMSMIGMGELGLVASLMWIFVSLKTWKVV